MITQAEREAYAELAELAAQWKRRAEWERQVRAVRRAVAEAPRVNGRPLKLTDTWPGVPFPPASNDEPFVLVRRVRSEQPPWRRGLDALRRISSRPISLGRSDSQTATRRSSNVKGKP